MANEIEDCETCEGERVVRDDADQMRPCPDCGDDAGVDVDDDRETTPYERAHADDNGHIERAFDFGGEA